MIMGSEIPSRYRRSAHLITATEPIDAFCRAPLLATAVTEIDTELPAASARYGPTTPTHVDVPGTLRIGRNSVLPLISSCATTVATPSGAVTRTLNCVVVGTFRRHRPHVVAIWLSAMAGAVIVGGSGMDCGWSVVVLEVVGGSLVVGGGATARAGWSVVGAATGGTMAGLAGAVSGVVGGMSDTVCCRPCGHHRGSARYVALPTLTADTTMNAVTAAATVSVALMPWLRTAADRCACGGAGRSAGMGRALAIPDTKVTSAARRR